VNDGVTVIMIASLDDGGFGIDAMSKRIADMYVPGVDIHGLAPKPDPAVNDTARLRTALTAIGAGREDERAPGLASRLPQPVRDRIAAAMRTDTSFDYLGEEAVGDGHFNPDPNLARNRWYRAETADGMRYFTLRLARDGRLLGVIIEE
jgi:hypothetical protein